jgi:hypothetical protein
MSADWVKLTLAAVIAGLGALLIAVEDDVMSTAEWVAVLLAIFTAMAGTEAVVQRSRAKKAEAEVEAVKRSSPQ